MFVNGILPGLIDEVHAVKVVLSAMFQDMRGSIEGSTFSVWKGLHYLRMKAATVSNPRTAAQVLVRASFAARVAVWNTLTPAEKAAWEEYAQARGSAAWWQQLMGTVGLIPTKGRLMSGLNAFIGVNALLVRAGYPTITDAPLPLTAVESPQLTNLVYNVGPPETVTGRYTTVENLAENAKALCWVKYEQAAGHAYIFEVGIEVLSGNPMLADFTLDTIRVGHGGSIQEREIKHCPGNYAFQGMLIDDAGHFSPSSNIGRIVVP